MKRFWSVLAKVLFVVALIQGWFLYDFFNKNQMLLAENIRSEQQLLTLDELLAAANKRIEVLEKNSIDNVLKETNKAVVEGWETLLDTVEGELEKAKKSIDSTIEGLRPEESIENNNLHTPKEEIIESSPEVISGERT